MIFFIGQVYHILINYAILINVVDSYVQQPLGLTHFTQAYYKHFAKGESG